MEIVTDSCIALAWFFKDESDVFADSILADLSAKKLKAVVPSLWFTEICNGMVQGLKRGRNSLVDGDAFLDDLMKLQVLVEPVNIQHVRNTFILADQYGLTSYDATYLELALRRKLPLATLDVPLHKAAQLAGTPAFPLT